MSISIDELSNAISLSFLEDRALAAFVLEVLDKAGYELVEKGQPRQADPGEAASLSTTSEQPANPAARRAYCNIETSGARGIALVCCQDSGHAGPHESFGGVQW